MKLINIDLTDTTVGRLAVISRSTKSAHLWECRCECGALMLVSVYRLVEGGGRRIVTGCKQCSQHRTHGMRGTKTYKAWSSMKHRCCNPRDPSYEHYGKRGIQVCPEWLNSFEQFYADMGEAPVGMSLDRENVHGNYSPDNCRWATAVQQGRNKQYNALVTVDGRTQTVAAWAEETGISQHTLYARKAKGWADEDVLSGKQYNRRTRLVKLGNQTKPLAAWCKELGVRSATICHRVRKGCSYEQALLRDYQEAHVWQPT